VLKNRHILRKLNKSNYRFLKNNKQNNTLILFAFIVGILAGGVGAIFRIVIGKMEVIRDFFFTNIEHGNITNWVMPVLFSVISIGLALFLVKRFAPEAGGSGIQEIEGALDKTRKIRWQRILPVKFFASILSLGSGLLLGREGPTIHLGANIGKMLEDVFKLSDKNENPLVSAGAAAGLASAFNAPLAGIIFVFEEMHGHFKYNFYSVAAIMIASGTADYVVRFFIGSAPVLLIDIFQCPELTSLWLFVLLGLFFGVVGFAYNKLLVSTLDFFTKMSKYRFVISIVLIGVIISVLGILFPDLIGGGYKTIKDVFDHSFTFKFLIIIFVVRFALSIISYGIGVPGGIFAPMLALGITFGMIFGLTMQHFFPEIITRPEIFAVVGMGGIFASTVRAPLTGLILVVEMTSNYELILPLIITTVISSYLTSTFGNQPIYSTLLNRTLLLDEAKKKKKTVV